MCFFCIKRCMELQTTLSGYLDTANSKTALDECCKRLLLRNSLRNIGRMIFPL